MVIDNLFLAKAKALLEAMEIKGICDGVYLFINEKVESMSIGDERDFIEAMMTKAVIDHFIKAWDQGCQTAGLNPHTIAAVLSKIQNI